MLSNAKKLIITIALIGSGAAGIGLLVADFNSPTLTSIEEIAQAISLEQDKFFAENGRYWQGLPHKGGLKPHYEAKGWDAFNSLSSDLLFEITVNQYVAPDGAGYQIIFKESGTTTSIGFGPEADNRTYQIIHNFNATST